MIFDCAYGLRINVFHKVLVAHGDQDYNSTESACITGSILKEWSEPQGESMAPFPNMD